MRSLNILSAMVFLAQAPAADREIDTWFGAHPTPAHLDGDMVVTLERPSVAADAEAISASLIDLSIRGGVPWSHGDVSLAVSRADLRFSQPITLGDGRVINDRLAYDEVDVFARAFVDPHTCVGYDLDLVHYAESAEISWRQAEITTTAFVHLDVQQTSSWIFLITYASQPNWELPRLLPGIAYCLRTDQVTGVIGFPYASLTWQAGADFAVNASFADEAKAGIAWTSPGPVVELTYTYAPRYFGQYKEQQIEPVLYQESTLVVTALIAAPVGFDWSVSLGRALTRAIGIESGEPVTRSIGGAWIASVELEAHL